MRKILIIAILLALSIAVTGQQPDIRADKNAPAEGEIKTLELKLAELIVHGEWDEYARHLSLDYLQTRDNGHVEYKEEAMANLRDDKRKIIVQEMEPDIVIRTYGGTAVSNAEFTITVRENGQVKSRRSRQTDVFVKRDGEWYLIAEQSTTIGRHGMRANNEASPPTCNLEDCSKTVVVAGEVAEWLKAPVLKTGVRETVPGVRIPPSPPDLNYLVLVSR